MKDVRTVKVDKHPFECPCYEIKEHYMETPQGDQFMHKIVHYPDSVAILPVTKDNKIVLVKEYRAAVGGHIISCPAGRINEGEEPLAAAKRELEEETGLVSTNFMERMYPMYVSPGYSTEKTHLYIAWDCEFAPESHRVNYPDENEYIELITMDIRNALGMGDYPVFWDMETPVGLKTSMLLGWLSNIKRRELISDAWSCLDVFLDVTK